MTDGPVGWASRPGRGRSHLPVVARLADGREILYFDDESRPARAPVPDARQLAPRPEPGQLRVDPLTGERVVIAAHRQTRTFLPPADECPLCPGHEVPDPAYDVVVFENRWPSFSGPSDEKGIAAAGRCEVVAFTDRHDVSFGQLPSGRVSTVVDAWLHRSRHLSGLDGVSYVALFENRGELIGVTLAHPHGQIYAYPFVPPVIERLQARAAGRPNLFRDVLDRQAAGPRVVLSDDYWLAFVPEAPRWPYEVLLMPRREVPLMHELGEQERAALSVLLPRLLGTFDRLFSAPAPYIAAWRQSAVGRDDLRLHLSVFSAQRAEGRLKYLAGSEAAYGAFINDVSPEAAAASLRAGIR